VSSFLVPSLARPSPRAFSAGRRSNDDNRPDDARTYNYPPKPVKVPPRCGIPFPPPDARGDIQQWLAAIDPFLPSHLRRDGCQGPDRSSTVAPLDLARVLNAAQDANLDIVGHLGLADGRWPAVVWIAKKLVESGRRAIEPAAPAAMTTNIVWPEGVTLQHLTEHPLRLERVRPSRKLNLSLDDVTAAPDSINLESRYAKRALGQLWRSLASMILAAAEQSAGEDDVMPHVLEIIAHLHHVGFMPESVYTYRPSAYQYALQQPPTIHIMSTKILTVLSDAAWRAHEASVKAATAGAKISYFLGHEIPGSRYKFKVSGVAPELWLELVLWTCLHGAWILDGAWILKRLASTQGKHGWGLISWREIVQAEQQTSPASPRSWGPFTVKEDTSASAEDRARIRRTISSEVVTAFVDAIVNEVRVGVGTRGTDPETLVKQINSLKHLLDSHNLSLGSTAWDSVLARLLESGGFVPEKRPELLLRMFELAAGFGAEISTANASTTLKTDLPYYFEPTTLPLTVLHRSMRAFLGNGDIKGAMTTLMMLQQHTDENKQKSMQQFFEMLKTQPLPKKDEPFTSHLPPVDFPAFDTKVPVPLRARLLDLATESKIYDLGRWFLFAQDLDGPLIGRDLYDHRNVAASIVRFGTLSGENDLVLRVVNRVGSWSDKGQQQRLPVEIVLALLCCQIQLRRWDSVRSMQQYVVENRTIRPRPVVLSTFVAELLRTSSDSQDESSKAQDAFTSMLFALEKPILQNMRKELYSLLAIMSTVDNEWQTYCSQFLAFSLRQKVKLSTNDFNHVLRGILDGYSSSKARETVEAWCYKPPITFEAYRAPGGLPLMSRFRVGKGKMHADQPDDILLVQDSGATLTLQGRVHPNRQTIRAILRKAQEEVDQLKEQSEDVAVAEREGVRDTLKWAARMLYYLGFDYEDIVRDMGSLAELAELERDVSDPFLHV
jgi:hypothetical protein